MSDIHALSGAYAVDALDDIERARFERHLSACDTCRDEVDSLREATVSLADSVALAPPDTLRERVLADIATFRPLPPVVAQPAQTPRRNRWSALVAAAAVIATLGAGAAVWHPWQETTSEISAADQVMRAPDAETFHQELPGGGTATVVRSKSMDRAVIRTQGLAGLPAGKVYELWFQHGDKMVAAGFLPSGTDTTTLLTGDASSASAVGITTEPEGGSPEPTLSTAVVIPFEGS